MVVCSLKQGPIYYVYSVYLLLALVATKPKSFGRWIYHLAGLQWSSCIKLMFSLCDPPLIII